MLRALIRIIGTFIICTLFMIFSKILFTTIVGGYTLSQLYQIIVHGLSMDMTIAGYVTVLPAIISVFLFLRPCHALEIIIKIYFGAISFLIALGVLSNAALYPYWGFPLDTTPMFYLISSPSSAFASMTLWEVIIALLAVGIYSCVTYYLFAYVYFTLGKKCNISLNISSKRHHRKRTRISSTLFLIILTGALFIPIRGGFTVSTMNLSRAYFSDDMKLNHAAVNPLFSFLYSATHQNNFKKQFRFMEDNEAEDEFQKLNSTIRNSEDLVSNNSASLTTDIQPSDIQLIILESFSAHLMPSLGGENIARRLDSIAQNGWLFKQIYASSFRTDRALPAILNGYPAQPTTSIMKYVNKLDSLPSIGKSFKDSGYSTTYLYGGDVNFTNMNALLVAGGFSTIIKDKDFPISERLSKWGVHDDKLFQKAWNQAKETKTRRNFTVIQTSSSHEPFEVPYTGTFNDKRVNAFAFTDSCLGAYIDSLKTLPNYDTMLIAIVADHYGAYPQGLDDRLGRHHIPLIFTGGFIDKITLDPGILEKIGSQTDIASTLLVLSGIENKDFIFSRNLLDPHRRAYAFFSEPSWASLLTEQGLNTISVETKESLDKIDENQFNWLKSYLQILYNDIDKR